MLLQLTMIGTEGVDARDLGYLLHKHPDKVQRFTAGAAEAVVFYPHVGEDRCTVALLLEVDPVALVRAKRVRVDGFTLAQYVNDRPYAASSMLAVAIGKVFSTAMNGVCAARPELAATPVDLELRLPAVPCRGGAELARRLLEPVGWSVRADPVPLDEQFPEWGESRYVDLVLTGRVLLGDALSHLYVLLPVLDNAKHYWFSGDEADKLVRRGGRWLAGHPERELITRRYLAHRRTLVTDATERLLALDVAVEAEPDPDLAEPEEDPGDAAEEARVPLAVQRRGAVLAALRDAGAGTVVDLGCGPGALLADLLADGRYRKILGVDVSPLALTRAERKLRLHRLGDRVAERISLVQSSATYRDDRLAGYDAVVLMEVIEHLDPERLPALVRSVFGHARPGVVVITTPNVEYNARYDTLPAGRSRHPDHRFEWTRAEFAAWAETVAGEYGYAVEFRPVGNVDAELGSPTQLALFRRATREEVTDA